jgi:hypothetical protein
MGKSLALLWVCLLVFGANIYAGVKGEWVGWLSDSKCAANGAKASHKGCTLKCVEAGQAIVFVKEDDKKVYILENPEKVKSFLGDRVQLSGSLEGDIIKVESAKKTNE